MRGGTLPFRGSSGPPSSTRWCRGSRHHDVEQDREIAWAIGAGDRQLGHVYGYRLDPIEEGTVVTQYCDWSGVDERLKASGMFPVISEVVLRATLGILARTVAPGVPRPAVETI